MKNPLSGNIGRDGAPRFDLGRIVATPGALELMQRTDTHPLTLLARHVSGDWGECCPEDAQTNEDALVHGSRVMSVYRLPLRSASEGSENAEQASTQQDVGDDRIWLITEADRSVTTLLLPEEY
ncbi:hypothetical protein [Variovorax atrisoli]|uniref:hypothetical protein n=1 Tax=Variovorax atrisoli TaxID=3394203 RepID=UPI00056E60C4|nr:hypothetical protein [Variovorax paradoxus]